jgi:cytochrome d ubiquinol oxidase subunit II
MKADLNTVWFLLIGLLWTGYFFLEGFDFGVGVLLPVLGRNETSRRMLIETIGPVWDANEVWLIVAGGATFAAFPGWYATMFSGFYLALFLILVALILRGVAFEFRNNHDTPRWRGAWDRAIFVGSLVPALLWGIAFGNILHGVPINGSKEFVGSLLDLLNPYAVFGGVTSLLLFTLHGAIFAVLKTTGELSERARTVARRLSWLTALAVVVYLVWAYVNAYQTGNKGVVPGAVPVIALLAVLAAPWLVRERLDGWAFAATGMTIVFLTATIFLNLYPRVMVSSLGERFDLTIYNTASTPYTLRVMTVVALIFTPIVLLYQGWTYWVFRKRITGAPVER